MSWSAFEESLIEQWILKVEGGLVDNPDDPGGLTKYGISQRAFPHLDIKNLTIQQACDIYYNNYYHNLYLDNYEFPLAFVCFDCAILCGQGWIQRTIRKDAYPVLGKDIMVPDSLAMYVLEQRIKYHTGDPNFRVFGQGWLNRVADLMDEYLKLKKIYNANGGKK